MEENSGIKGLLHSSPDLQPSRTEKGLAPQPPAAEPVEEIPRGKILSHRRLFSPDVKLLTTETLSSQLQLSHLTCFENSGCFLLQMMLIALVFKPMPGTQLLQKNSTPTAASGINKIDYCEYQRNTFSKVEHTVTPRESLQEAFLAKK